MIGLAVIALVLVGAVALATSTVVGISLPGFARLDRVAPARRVRMLMGLLLSPAFAGLLVLALAFGPCVATRAMGVPDECSRHGGPHLLLCLQRGAEASAIAWLLGALCFGRALFVLEGVWRTARMSAQLARALKLVGARNEAHGYVVVPGQASFTAGWPLSDVFIGSDVIRSLDAVGLASIVAHERAHQRGAHVSLKLAARMLAAFHLPSVGRRLVAELDTALEQACDAEAARVVGDPISVAESLLAVARNHLGLPSGALAGFTETPSTLNRRVVALCDPPWPSPGHGHLGLAMGIVAALLVMVAFTFDRPLHDATEAALQFLGV